MREPGGVPRYELGGFVAGLACHQLEAAVDENRVQQLRQLMLHTKTAG